MIGYAYGKLIISEPKGSPYIYILYTKNSWKKILFLALGTSDTKFLESSYQKSQVNTITPG